jgi:hypothetical protein
MILQIPIGRVEGFIDSAQIGVSVGRPGWAISLRGCRQEHGKRNAGGNRGVNKVPHGPVSMLCEDGILVKLARKLAQHAAPSLFLTILTLHDNFPSGISVISIYLHPWGIAMTVRQVLPALVDIYTQVDICTQDVKAHAGNVTKWQHELASPHILLKQGWRRDGIDGRWRADSVNRTIII